MSDKYPQTAEPSPSNPSSSESPKLQRETVVMVNDRGRLGLLVALCSLAGVAVGFGLSNMAAAISASNHCSMRARAPQVHIVAPAETETPTWLGVRISTHQSGGAYVEVVEPGSPALRAGIQPGDVIVGFTANGCPKRMDNVHTASDLVRLVRSADVGDLAVVKLERAGESTVVRTRLRHMPQSLFYEELNR